MKKQILLVLSLSLSIGAVAFAAPVQYSGAHLGEEKLSEISSGAYKCEFARGNIEKESKSTGVASVPVLSGSAKAGSAR